MAFDNSPFSPSTLAHRLWRARLKARRAVAMRDPVFAHEESRRRVGTGVIAVGEDLPFDGFLAHERLFEKLAPATGFDEFLLSVYRGAHLGAVSGQCLRVFDLLSRGWSEQDVHSLGLVQARRMGQMLLALADTAHGWPDASFESFAQWQDALREHGSSLVAYADGAHFPYTDGQVVDLDVRAQQLTEYEQHSRQLALDASLAWQWVAQHHEDLWD